MKAVKIKHKLDKEVEEPMETEGQQEEEEEIIEKDCPICMTFMGEPIRMLSLIHI